MKEEKRNQSTVRPVFLSGINDRELKRLKRKQKESQRSTAGSPPASNEDLKALASTIQPETLAKSCISSTPILPPKLLASSQPSVASASSQHTKSHKNTSLLKDIDVHVYRISD